MGHDNPMGIDPVRALKELVGADDSNVAALGAVIGGEVEVTKAAIAIDAAGGALSETGEGFTAAGTPGGGRSGGFSRG